MWAAVRTGHPALAVSAATRLQATPRALALEMADAVCQGSSAVALVVSWTSNPRKCIRTNGEQASLLEPRLHTCSHPHLHALQYHQQQSQIPPLTHPPLHPPPLPPKPPHPRHLHRQFRLPTRVRPAGSLALSVSAVAAAKMVANVQQAHPASATYPAARRHQKLRCDLLAKVRQL